ncbi:MAG: DNA glycosylase AlkZ-like family protein [Bacillota bacterium]
MMLLTVWTRPISSVRSRIDSASAWEMSSGLGGRSTREKERQPRPLGCGPRSSREIESDEKVVGYWDSAPRTKATSLALELLWEAGDLMIARRNGIEKVYDVPERLVPSELRSEALEMSEDEVCRTLLDKYYRAYRLLDTGDFRFGWRKMPAAERRDVVARQVAEGELVPVEVEGVRRQYYALAADAPLLRHLDDPELEVVPNVFILPPLDNVLWRRERLADLFGFDYTWEIYISQAKRRFGAYAPHNLADPQRNINSMTCFLFGYFLILSRIPRCDRIGGQLLCILKRIGPSCLVGA